MRPSQLGEGYAARLRLRATDGTMVVLLSPMLEEHLGTAAITLAAAAAADDGGRHPAAGRRACVHRRHRTDVVDLAWRMRRLERDELLAGLAAPGARWWPGAGPAPSTTCSGGWPAGRSCPRWLPDEAGGVDLPRAGGGAPGAGGCVHDRRRGTAPVSVFVLLALLGVGWAAFPESAAGAVVLILVISWWGVGLRDGLDPWALPAAAALLAAHVAAVLVSYGPVELPVDGATTRLWARRAALVFLVVPLTYGLAVWVRDEPAPGGMWVAGLAAAFAALLLASLTLSVHAQGDTTPARWMIGE